MLSSSGHITIVIEASNKQQNNITLAVAGAKAVTTNRSNPKNSKVSGHKHTFKGIEIIYCNKTGSSLKIC